MALGSRDSRFMELLEKEQTRLVRLARLLADQEADVWDYVQEATLTAYASFASFRGSDASFGPWIRRILVSRAINAKKRSNRLLPLSDPQVINDSAHEQAQVESFSLWEEVLQLPVQDRQVLVLRYMLDLSISETARLLRIPEGTVKSRAHRALGALKTRLGPEEEEHKGGP